MAGQHRRLVGAALVALLTVVAGCGPGATPAASPSPGPSDGGSQPSPSPSPGSSASAAAFKLIVVPTTFSGLIHSGAKVVLLVSVDGSPADGPVDVTASVPGGTASVQPAKLVPGSVAEVTLTGLTCPSSCEQAKAEVRIVAARGSVTRTETREMTLTPEVNQLEPEARAHLAPFLAWLAVNRPELGLTPQTQFESVPAPWLLIVDHHTFFSKDWEIDISWHVMIAPDDWSRIELRHRGTELVPSLAFQIDSVSGKTTPHPVQPADGTSR